MNDEKQRQRQRKPVRDMDFDDHNTKPATSLGEALEQFLKTQGLMELSREKLCPLVWGEVVGDWYSSFTHVTRVRDGIAWIKCDSAPRANQLQLDAPDIIVRLNHRLGGNYIKELRPSSTGPARPVITGAADPEPTAPSDGDLDAIELETGTLAHIKATAQEIPDEDLRESLERILVNQAKLRVWQAQHGYTKCKRCGAYSLGERQFCLACDPLPRPSQAGGEEGLSKYSDDSNARY